MNTYDIGDDLRLSIALVTLADAAADPTALTLTVALPNNTTKVYGWPTPGPDGSITKDGGAGSGTFHLDFGPATVSGLHVATWVATGGGVVEAEPQYFFVRQTAEGLDELTDLLTVKTYLNITNSGDDWLLQTLIAGASAFIEQQLNRNVKSRTYVETIDGTDGHQAMVREKPITAVTSVTINGVSIPAASSSIANGFVFDTKTPILSLRGYLFSRGFQNVVISYTAGYATVPADVEQACIDLVGKKYKQRDHLDQVSKALAAGETITFSAKDMDENTKRALAPYRRVAPV